MTTDDAFFFDFLPGSKAIPELSKQFMNQLITLPDKAVTTFNHLLDKINAYLGGQFNSKPQLPFFPPPQDLITYNRLQEWVLRNKCLVLVLQLAGEVVEPG